MTPKENLLAILRGETPEYLPAVYSPFKMVVGDPISRYLRGNRIRGTNSYDCWGTYIMFPEDAPAAIPCVTEDNQVIQDITCWRDYVHVPDLAAKCSDGWEAAKAACEAIDRDRYLSMVSMGTGIFEQVHMLMTFEDTLVNLLAEPDDMHDLIDTICEYRLTYMKMIVENLHPDVICSHDDWGAKTSLFMSPDTWRSFFKEPYRKLYSYLHENNVIVIHHGDSFMEPLAEDMAEIGIDIWQGVLPTNDIESLSKKLNGKMALMGGIDSIIDRADATEEEIRAETRRACEAYGHLKGFIPSMTYGGPASLFPHVYPIVTDEICKFNMERFGKFEL